MCFGQKKRCFFLRFLAILTSKQAKNPEISNITIFIFICFFKNQKQTPKYIFPPIFRASVRFFKNESKLCSDGMSCNKAHLITQTVSEVVTHYTGYYTAKNRKKCSNYTKKHKFQGSFF